MRSFLIVVAVAVTSACNVAAHAESFYFESSADALDGVGAGVKTDGGRAMSVAAAPAGAVFDIGNSGLGLNSRAVPGATDGEIDKFNVLGGSAAGVGESITFSFDAPGYITTLDFDGVKDESFEFFRLETPGGEVWSIFDSQIGLRLVDLSLISEPNVTLLTEAGAADDDLFGIAIPFAAGETFTLTYDEYTPDPSNYQPGITPEAPNGARFQGLVVTFVPEPSSALLAVVAAAGISRRLRRTA